MADTNIVSLSKAEIDNLSNDALCNRMELILHTMLCESYQDPRAIENFPRQSINEFYISKKIQSLPQMHQRAALKKCFEYLVQHEYLSRLGGWANQAIYGQDYNEAYSWLSPKIQSINAAIKHMTIVGSGVACERMMDLLHVIETGKPLESASSKFNKFKKWILDPHNQFVFFAPNLVPMNKFRSSLRTAEVHEWSSLSMSLLQLQRPSFESNNIPLNLLNLLISMWMPLILILNDQIPATTQGSGAGINWLEAIKNHNIAEIKIELDRLVSELK